MTSNLEKSDELVHCSVENAEEEEEEEEEEEDEDDFGCLATFWFGTFAMLFSAMHWVCYSS